METVLIGQSDVCRLQIITQWFEPEPAFKGLAFATEMANRGFDVEVITGFPNYPSGKLYPGYRIGLPKREVIDGVKVVRLPLYPSHDSSAIRRALNFVSFGVSVLLYGLFGMRRADVIYGYHPPLTVGLAAIFIRLLRRVPVVYDVQDLWPDTLAATGMLRNRFALGVVGLICRLVYRFVDRIAVLSSGFKDAIVAQGIPEDKVTVIRNWANEDVLRTSTRETRSPSREGSAFQVLYAGNIGKAQGLEVLLDVAKLLDRCSRQVKFVIIGDGVERLRLQKLVREKGLNNLEFRDPVPLSEIGASLLSADALLVHLSPDPLFDITIPSKTQAYLCVGRPLVMAVGGEASALVRQAGAGVVATPGDAVSIANAIMSLMSLSSQELDEMGARGRRFYDAELSMGRGLDAFAKLFRRPRLG
jgi:glycosyltransferase involved in cell wall biosynthesis